MPWQSQAEEYRHNLQGKVYEKSTGMPLHGANVLVEGTQSGDATNINGQFELNDVFPAKGSIVVSMLGYQSEKIEYNIFTEEFISVGLSQKAFLLDRTFVSAPIHNKIPNKILRYLSSSSSAEEALTAVAGVNLMKRGQYGQDPVLRGLSGSQINVLIDGMRVFGACTDRMDPATSYVDIDALGKVQIVSGGFDPQFGGGTGGSISLDHRKPSFKADPNLQLHFGSVQQWGENSNRLFSQIEWARENIAIRTAGVYRKASDYKSPNGLEQFTAYEKFNLVSRILWRVNSNQTIGLDLQSDDAWDIGYAALPMDVGYARFRSASLTWNASRVNSQINKIEMQLYHNRVDHFMDDSKRSDLLMGMRMDMPGRTRTNGSTVSIHLLPANHWLISTRFETFVTDHFADMLMHPKEGRSMYLVTWPEVQTISLCPYFGLHYSHNRIDVSGSLRYDLVLSEPKSEFGRRLILAEYSQSNLKRNDHLFNLSLSVGLQQKHNSKSVVSYAYTMRSPSTTEAFGYYLYNASDGYLYNGNPDIKPENAHQFQVQQRVNYNWFSGSVSVFHYNIGNSIYGAVDTSAVNVPFANGWKRTANARKATLNGIEISVNLTFNSQTSLHIATNWQVGRLDDENDYMPMVPPLELRSSLKWHNEYFSFMTDIRGAAKQINLSRLNLEDKTSSFLILNMNIETTIFSGVTLTTGVNNLTNEKYNEHLDWQNLSRPGRSLIMGLDWQH